MKSKKILKFVLIAVVLLLIAGIPGFVVWVSFPLGPMEEALTALESDDQIIVQTDPWMTFTPTDMQPEIGLILYPGGRVDARSYAPTARAIAEEGYFVVIPPMPLNLAVFNPDAAADVIDAFDNITTWVVGGHSLGGAMAANYVFNQPDAAQGLLLWASYPADNNSLAERDDLPTTSIFGTEDGGAEELAAAGDLLPSDTVWKVIEGGNHAQFGWYGPQPGDGEAMISREEQQAQIVETTTSLLISLP